MSTSFQAAHGLVLLAAILVSAHPWCSAQSPEAMGGSPRFSAKFLGEELPTHRKAICWFTPGQGR